MAPKLNQIIAIANGTKTKCGNALTATYQKMAKSALFEGITRNYFADKDGDETFPPENKNVQYKVKDAVNEARQALSELFNITATQDWANCNAKADITVDGNTIVSKVPVTYLLFLEKQLVDVQTFVTKIPTLDPAENWSYNQNADCFSSTPHRTSKMKKETKVLVKYEATKEHPAQTETYSAETKQGEWETIKFSGAISAVERNQLLDRVAKLIIAVKFAREQANNMDVEVQDVAKPVFNYLFG